MKETGADPWPLDQGVDADLLLDVAYLFPPVPDQHIGVAVSGGGDSVALLHLMVRACRHWGVPVSAVTVDHRLRAASAQEAAVVADLCATLDVPHATLIWEHGAIAGNLMDAARHARTDLITDWAPGAGVTHVALGHTADDQAETFLMALSRAAGLDGLAGMRRSWRHGGLRWDRPLLDWSRASLRAYLRRQGLSWIEDPTNEDGRFERTKARQAIAALTLLGIDGSQIARSVSHLSDGQHAIKWALEQACAMHANEMGGAMRIDRAQFQSLPLELRRQMISTAVSWLRGGSMPLRSAEQINLLQAALNGRDATLRGCRLVCRQEHLWLTREPRAVVTLSTPTDAPWDHRWHLSGLHAPDLMIRALGADGLRACKDWRDTGLPREVLIVTPGVWRGETLVAAPLAGWPQGWTATVSPSFAATILAH